MASVCKTCGNKGCQMYGEAFLKTCKEYVPMGVEERAEQYSDRYSLLSVENIELIKKAYIAGYNDAIKVKVNMTRISDAPNGIVWHKVADGDLPKEYTEVLDDEGRQVELRKGHWRFVYGSEWEDDAIVIAWCEIPRYEGV